MAKTGNSNSLIITNENFNEWLGSVGYLFPTTEIEKNRFDKLFEDYEYKLSQRTIDVGSIMSGTYTCESYSARIIEIDNHSIDELKMVARNGDAQVPDDIISRMKAKHRKKNDDDKK